jgi:xanthine dehydrogenase accessory factor
MRELETILAAWRRWQYEPLAMATVARTRGSSYRRPGARMLVRKTGETVGAISGGCLEQDVIARAKRVLASGVPEIAVYDTADEADLLLGTNLGCEGVIEILLEPLPPRSLESPLGVALARPLELRRTTHLGTVLVAPPGCDYTLAQHVVGSQGAFAMLEREAPGLELLVETLLPTLRLVVFGAGQDVPPLVAIARDALFHVTVVDRRPAMARRERFPRADAVLSTDLAALPLDLVLDARTAAVVMTHNFLDDRALLAQLLPRPLAYLGLLGPKRRGERLLRELEEQGLALDEAARARLHAPAGLDLGAETPEQVALAILAEIHATLTNRPGGRLKERVGSIHGAG